MLAPMSGVTDCAFRMLVRSRSGDDVGLLVSEFIAAEGLTRDNQKTLSMLRYDEAERPVSIQIFGSDVDRMVRAAVMVEEAGADIVDINCGCPAPKVVRRGGGAEMMRQPDRLRQILRGIHSAVSIPLTVKMRSGWDDHGRNAVEIAKMAEQEGAAMVAVHGRTRVQLYTGEADWDMVGAVREAVSIPVLGSGDITRPEHARKRLAGGYADGLMIGRGAIDNPWIFRDIATHLAGEEVVAPDAEERVEAMSYFRDALRETKEERAFLGRYRGLACRMVKGMRGGAGTRRAIGASAGVEAIDEIFARFVRTGTLPEGADPMAAETPTAAEIAEPAVGGSAASTRPTDAMPSPSGQSSSGQSSGGHEPAGALA